jgi:hypothetical protein
LKRAHSCSGWHMPLAILHAHNSKNQGLCGTTHPVPCTDLPPRSAAGCPMPCRSGRATPSPCRRTLRGATGRHGRPGFLPLTPHTPEPGGSGYFGFGLACLPNRRDFNLTRLRGVRRVAGRQASHVNPARHPLGVAPGGGRVARGACSPMNQWIDADSSSIDKGPCVFWVESALDQPIRAQRKKTGSMENHRPCTFTDRPTAGRCRPG